MKRIIIITIVFLFFVQACSSVRKDDITQTGSNTITSGPGADDVTSGNQNGDSITTITPPIDVTSGTDVTPSIGAYPNTEIEPSITPNPESEKIYKDYTIKEIKDAIINSINNDIWYDGEKSYYYDFQDKELGFELYDEDNYPHLLHVVFTDKAKYINFASENYFAITLSYNNGGFSTTDIGFCDSVNLEDIREMLTDGGELIYSDKIKFEKAEEPYIQSNESGKDKLVASIKDEFHYFMDDIDKGSYDAKIVNFTTFDTRIYMILENADDKWLVVFSNLDGAISFFKIFDSADPDSDFAYHPINQYEKNVLEEFTFENN